MNINIDQKSRLAGRAFFQKNQNVEKKLRAWAVELLSNGNVQGSKLVTAFLNEFTALTPDEKVLRDNKLMQVKIKAEGGVKQDIGEGPESVISY